jgi:hypothetical protein
MLIFFRKIISRKNFTNRAWTHPAFHNFYFFRLLFTKPLGKRLSRFLAIMTRANTTTQNLKTMSQKKLTTTNARSHAKQIEGYDKGF